MNETSADLLIFAVVRIADALEAAVEEIKEINDTLAGIEQVEQDMHALADPNVRYQR